MFAGLIELIGGLKAKLILYGGLALVVLLFILRVYLKGRSDGNASLRQELDTHRQKVENGWNKIDSQPLPVDVAVDRLRQRAAKAGYNAKP